MSDEAGAVEGSYSAVADQQLDAIEASDASLYNDILTVCELIFTDSFRARSMSAAVRAEHGIVLRLAVPGRHPYSNDITGTSFTDMSGAPPADSSAASRICLLAVGNVVGSNTGVAPPDEP